MNHQPDDEPEFSEIHEQDPEGPPDSQVPTISEEHSIGPSLDALLSLDQPASWQEPATSFETDLDDWQQQVGADDELAEIAVDDINPNPYQPRRVFDEVSLASLSESVRELGVLQPIVVRPKGDGSYELIAGERRWRATRLAGLTSIPAIVRRATDRRSLEEAIVENLHRDDLNVFEEAEAYKRLMADHGLTQDDVAQRVGRSRSAVANILRLAQLTGELRRMVLEGELGAGHARTLLPLGNSPQIQMRLAKRAVRDSLSVRQLEDLVKARLENLDSSEEGRSAPESGRSASVLEVEKRLSERLETRVSVVARGKRGRIVIQFADDEDLGRIYELLDGIGQEGRD